MTVRQSLCGWVLAAGLSAFASAAGAQVPPRRDAPPAGPGFVCGTKRYCTQMTSCAEVRFHFEVCGLRRLDGDRDGVPCERLCGQGSRGGSTWPR